MMSEARMRNTDFSIARILSDEHDDRSTKKTRTERKDEDFAGRKLRVRFPTLLPDARNEERGASRREEMTRREESPCADDRVVLNDHTTFASAGCATQRENDLENIRGIPDLTWLQYTRYRPPKLPRRSYVEKRTIKRRTDDRPRIPFSSSQLQVLEDRYRRSAYLSRNDVVEMSAILRLPQSKIKIWFQNRRARQRRESLNSTIVAR